MSGERRRTGTAERDKREERLAAALRENLRRRKERVRSAGAAAPRKDTPRRPL